MTHPGVGPITGLAYALVIGTPGRFPCGKQIGSYTGLIPSEDSSAGKQRLGHISKQGNALLRFLLGEAAQAAARCDPDWRRRYMHLMMRREKRIAKVAMASETRRSVVLDVAKQLAICAVGCIRFERGKARNRPWREVERRPLDWASRSLKRGV